MDEQLLVLKRVGAVLIIVGLVDIAVMIYCIANGISYSSSFNVFAVVAGIFLRRGSLRAVSIVLWLATVLLVTYVGFPLVRLLLEPLELIWLSLRLRPGAFSVSVGLWVCAIFLLWWVIKELRHESVSFAREQAGKKVWSMRIPISVGSLVLIVLAIVVPMALRGETGRLAKAKAMGQLGSEYKYVVSSLTVHESKQGKSITAVVTAYNDHEIRMVPVRWSEQ